MSTSRILLSCSILLLCSATPLVRGMEYVACAMDQESSLGSASSEASSSSSSSAPLAPLSRLMITEVLPDPEGSDTEEWVEIGNLGQAPAIIAGLTLSTGTGSARRNFLIPVDSSGGILQPGSFRSFRSNMSKLTLANAGSSVRLLSGALLLDQMIYPALPESLSYGRDLATGSLRTFCVPTEREPNADLPAGLSILVQSGELTASEETSINLAAQALYPGALQGAACRWQYPDGYSPEVCNPPSRTLTTPGVHLVTLHARLACGREERATITVRIGQSQSNPAPLVPDNLEPSATTPSPVRITGLMRSDQGKGGWIALRNFSPDPLRLEGFSIHGGIIPNHFSILPPTQLMPREERRFTLASLRLALADEGRIILRDPGGASVAQLDWSDTEEKKIHRPVVLTPRTIDVQVARVLSGDTFAVTLTDIDDPDIPPSVLHRWRRQELSDAPGIVLRLIGVEAPPVYDENGRISEIGMQALNFVSDLIYNKKIELEFDSIIWDTYERVLAYARVPESSEFLQAILLQKGFAKADQGSHHPMRDAFVALEQDAQKKQRGLWATTMAHQSSIAMKSSAASSSASAFSRLQASSWSFLRVSSSPKQVAERPIQQKSSNWMKVKWVASQHSASLSASSQGVDSPLLTQLNTWKPYTQPLQEHALHPWYKRVFGAFCLFGCGKKVR